MTTKEAPPLPARRDLRLSELFRKSNNRFSARRLMFNLDDEFDDCVSALTGPSTLDDGVVLNPESKDKTVGTEKVSLKNTVKKAPSDVALDTSDGKDSTSSKSLSRVANNNEEWVGVSQAPENFYRQRGSPTVETARRTTTTDHFGWELEGSLAKLERAVKERDEARSAMKRVMGNRVDLVQNLMTETHRLQRELAMANSKIQKLEKENRAMRKRLDSLVKWNANEKERVHDRELHTRDLRTRLKSSLDDESVISMSDTFASAFSKPDDFDGQTGQKERVTSSSSIRNMKKRISESLDDESVSATSGIFSNLLPRTKTMEDKKPCAEDVSATKDAMSVDHKSAGASSSSGFKRGNQTPKVVASNDVRGIKKRIVESLDDESVSSDILASGDCKSMDAGHLKPLASPKARSVRSPKSIGSLLSLQWLSHNIAESAVLLLEEEEVTVAASQPTSGRPRRPSITTV